MAKITKKRPETHPKAWGAEYWIENCPEYCGKILKFDKNFATSLHYHVKKLETMYLRSGHLEVYLIDPENTQPYIIDLHPGDVVQIPRNQVHQIRAQEDSELFEFSTYHDEADSFRITRDIL